MSELSDDAATDGGGDPLDSTATGTAGDDVIDVRFANRVLDTAVRVGGVGVWEWDATTRRMRWNDEVRRLLGVASDAEASWERWIAAVHPDDRAAARAAARAGYADGEVRYRIMRTDGDVRDVLVRGESFHHGGHDIMVGVGIDVTEVTQAQAKMARILEAMSDGYLAMDRDWRVVAINSHAEHLIQRSADTVIGRVLWELFPVLRGTAGERAARRVMETRRPEVIEERYGSGDTWFEVRLHSAGDNLVAYFRDITRRRARDAERDRLLAAERSALRAAEAAHAAMAHQATHDSLTGLFNRPEVMRRIDVALSTGQPVGLLFIDLDRFKLINDSLGHGTGDLLLRTIAMRIRDTIGPQGTVARLGGDEFVVALTPAHQVEVDAHAEAVGRALRTPINLGGLRLVSSASMGLTMAAAPATSGTLLRDADAALHRAKSTGRDCAVWFDDTLRRAAVERLSIEHDLREAVGQGAIRVAHQPVFDLTSGGAVGAEVLARWRHPLRGDVRPGVFIPVAEESGLILEFGEAVTLMGMRDGAQFGADWTTWVNLSPRQFTRPGLADMIERQLGASGLDPRRLGLEITESAFAESDAVYPELWRLREMGVRMAIDDFGTGHSSIARLRELPIDVLKIDRAFVRDSVTPGGGATIRAIVELGHALGMKLIAEGVETTEQLRRVRAAGCDMVAGYFLARPVAAADVAEAAETGLRVLDSSR